MASRAASRLFGHTLGTPQLEVVEALEFFARLGLDGAEVIWENGYRSALPEGDGEISKLVRATSGALGLEIGCLTPYMTGLNSLDESERRRDIERFVACIQTAESLGCSLVRVYSGRLLQHDQPNRVEHWKRLTDSLSQLAKIAAEAGVTLAVENHFNTMTVTAEQTVALIAEIGSDAIGALYDQANLAFTHSEMYPEAINLQKSAICYVHVKDLEFLDQAVPFTGGNSVMRVETEQRAVRSRVIGDGILEWPAILSALAEVGYRGPYSLEYEYRWHPQDLPDPEIGFSIGRQRLRSMLDSIVVPKADGIVPTA